MRNVIILHQKQPSVNIWFTVGLHPSDFPPEHVGRRSFTLQKASFQRLKGGLLQAKRPPFATRLIISGLQRHLRASPGARHFYPSSAPAQFLQYNTFNV